MNRNLTDSELSKVFRVIESHLGLDFPPERWAMLGHNLASAAHESGFPNMDEFIHWLLTIKLNHDHIKILASHLTISETSFWREQQVFSALTDHILPGLISKKKSGEKSISIWSAGCSTGEEPYSIAIALKKTVPKIEDWNISILATDINHKAIDKAKTGIYRPWSFRNTPHWLKTGYFHNLEDRQYEIVPEIRNMVTFSCQNLLDMAGINEKGSIDIIFCRNVLMYFTGEWVKKISKNLYHRLSDEGWLVVSTSELSSSVFSQFTTVSFPGTILYRKVKKGAEKSELSYSTLKPVRPFNHSTFQHFNPSTIQPFNPSPFTPDQAIKPLQTDNSSTIQQSCSVEKTPEELSSDKIFAIRLLANQGYLSESLSLCNEAIVLDKLVPGFYFLRASILQEMDKNPEAVESLKQTVYLDPDFVMGHFALANLFTRKGNIKSATRYFNNVLGLLEKYSNDDIVSDSDGLSVKYIKEIIFANMEATNNK